METKHLGFKESRHSIEPSSKPQYVFGAKRENDIKQYEDGNIKFPELLTLNAYMKGFRIPYLGKDVIITTYLHNNSTLYTLYSIGSIHMISHPDFQNDGSFKNYFFNTLEKPENILSCARGLLVKYACEHTPTQLKPEQEAPLR